jgi:predicted NACHT family NTPase
MILLASSRATRNNGQAGPATEVLRRSQRVLLRGPAGSGKTTLLRWLAVRAASSDFAAPLDAWNDMLPLYLRLRDYHHQGLPGVEQLAQVTVTVAGHRPSAG